MLCGLESARQSAALGEGTLGAMWHGVGVEGTLGAMWHGVWVEGALGAMRPGIWIEGDLGAMWPGVWVEVALDACYIVPVIYVLPIISSVLYIAYSMLSIIYCLSYSASYVLPIIY